MGDTEISFGAPEVKRHIHTSSEWSSAWRWASKAITFAFPHCEGELLEYGDYIKGEFAAKLPSSHPKLLLYDTALRNEVGAGQHILLTETHRFNQLYSAIVMPDGVECGSSNSTKRKGSANSGSSKSDICNKFNAGTCKSSDSECKYRHVCKECQKPGQQGENVRRRANEVYGLQPKYLRHNLWEESPSLSLTCAKWTEHALPLPQPPLTELLNPIISKTITDNLDLFQIVTPINIVAFEELLSLHPNQLFVWSVCTGLREGFWPWADTSLDSLPAVTTSKDSGYLQP